MKEQKGRAEARILEAATAVFVEKGMAGARMQEIADRAGINKALLHYYFKSKERLFDAILEHIVSQIFPVLSSVSKSAGGICERIDLFVDAYLDVLLRNPLFPSFVLAELNQNTGRLEAMLAGRGIDVQSVLQDIETAMLRSEIRRLEPKHLVINIIGMCVFPFLAAPVAREVLFAGDAEAYGAFLQMRKAEVKSFIFQSIKL